MNNDETTDELDVIVDVYFRGGKIRSSNARAGNVQQCQNIDPQDSSGHAILRKVLKIVCTGAKS